MTIEQTLERIAVALEKLAEQKSSAPTSTGKAVTQETKPEPQRTRPGKKVEEPKEELTLEQEVHIDNTQEGFEDTLPIKFADLNKAWFGMLSKAREQNLKNGDTAQQSLAKTQVIAKRLMAIHCDGQKFSEATVKPENFAAFLADIEAEEEAIEALNG